MTKKKQQQTNEPGFIRGLLAWNAVPRRCNRFQQLQAVQKFSGMDWSFCRFLIALSTAIRLMTTASSAIASRFTWRNMAQECSGQISSTKKKQTTVHLGFFDSRFQDVSVLLPQITLQKKNGGSESTPSAHRKVWYLHAFAFRSPRGPWHL